MKNIHLSLYLMLGLLILTQKNTQAQSLRISYYGETITHYGLKTAYEYPIFSKIKERNQSRKMLLIAPSAALYRHPHNHFGIIIAPELIYRRIGKRSTLFEAGIAPAYFRYFLEGSTYQVTANGELERVRYAGGNAFLPTVFLGVGRDLSVRHSLPFTWYTRLNISQQRPYNTSALTRFSLEIGAIFPFKKQ